MSAPEDTILMKLRWCEMSGASEKQFGDALAVYEVQHGAMDEVYLRHWVGELKLDQIWERLIQQAEVD